MHDLFENWRHFIKEDVIDLASRRKTNDKEFIFDQSELNALNDAIARILAAAKSPLAQMVKLHFLIQTLLRL